MDTRKLVCPLLTLVQIASVAAATVWLLLDASRGMVPSVVTVVNGGIAGVYLLSLSLSLSLCLSLSLSLSLSHALSIPPTPTTPQA
jgi:uncharacterized protein (DUF58 family)